DGVLDQAATPLQRPGLVNIDAYPTRQPVDEVVRRQPGVDIAVPAVDRGEQRRHDFVEGAHHAPPKIVFLKVAWQEIDDRARSPKVRDHSTHGWSYGHPRQLLGPGLRHQVGHGYGSSTRTWCSYEKTRALGATSTLCEAWPRSPVIGLAANSLTSS